MTRDAYTLANNDVDIITLVAGDVDFVPSIRFIAKDGFTVEVEFWGHATNKLKEACTKFIDFTLNLEHFSY